MDDDSAKGEQHRIGTVMVIVMWVLLLVIVSYFFGNLLDQQNNPNQVLTTQYISDNIREVRLERNRYGHYVTNGSINGKQVVFMLDTGATGVAVPEHMVQRLGLVRGMPIEIQTANGVARAYMSSLQRVGIGEIELQDVGAYINPNDQQDEILLGMTFLKHIEFTQRGDTLILRQYVQQP
jgi:aspartyl protease family protein